MFVFPIPEIAERLLSRPEAAELIGVHFKTLVNWAETGYGPRPIKIGTFVAYDKRQVEAFLESAGVAR